MPATTWRYGPGTLRPSKEEISTMTPLTRPRLGPHHFAHLRAVAEGIDIQASAKRYLGVEHGHQAKTAHAFARDAVRALARRHADSAWHLIGAYIPLQQAANSPSLDAFMMDKDLADWPHAEVEALYLEAYPVSNRRLRRTRLQERQLQLLHKLSNEAAEQPQANDMVSGWFEAGVADKLISAGVLTLGDLSKIIARGGCWYAALAHIGRAKASRIETFLVSLLPAHLERRQQPSFFSLPYARLLSAPLPATPAAFLPGPPQESALARAALRASGLEARTDLRPLLCARHDLEAVEAWIAARAGSRLTATAYRREALRVMLWLQDSSARKTLAAMTVNDCGDYMAFLQNVPAGWISRRRAKPGAPGWAPFRGPLSHASQGQAVLIVAGMFRWLQAAKYLMDDPWVLVNQKTGDDADKKLLESKAFSEVAMAEIWRFIEGQPPSPSRSRIRFILRFCEAVGLRSSELLGARLGDLQRAPEGWVLQVHGKGAKNRLAVVPGQAVAALQDYLAARGLGAMESAPLGAPLLSSTVSPLASVGYQALYEHVKGWLRKAVSQSALPLHERDKLAGASTHWLRHTFGTRAVARSVPLDVIQAQMGHASIQTTMSTYGRAPLKRRVDEIAKAFGETT